MEKKSESRSSGAAAPASAYGLFKKYGPFLLLVPALAFKLTGWFNSSPVFAGRPMTYVQPAEELLSGTYSGIESFRRTPGYPAFLAGVFAVGGKEPGAVTLSHVFLSLGTAAVVIKTALVACAGPYGAAAAGAVILFHPYLNELEKDVESETLAVFLMSLFFYFTVSALTGNAAAGRLWLISGLAGSAAALTRPELAVLAVAPLPFMPAANRGRLTRIFLAAFVLPLALWSVRNLAVFGAFTLSPMGAITSVQTSHPLIDWDSPGHKRLKEVYQEVLDERGGNHNGAINEALARLGPELGVQNAVMEGYNFGREILQSAPLRYLLLTGGNFVDYIESTGALLFLALAGFFASLARYTRRAGLFFAAGFLLLMTGSCLVELGLDRRSAAALPVLSLLFSFLPATLAGCYPPKWSRRGAGCGGRR